MPKREKEPISRHHFWIYTRDYERLKTFFGDSIGMSNGVRQIIHNYMSKMEARALASARHPAVEDLADLDAGIPHDGIIQDDD